MPGWFNFQVHNAATPDKDAVKDFPRVLHIDYPSAILRLMENTYQGKSLTWDSTLSGIQGLHLAMVAPYHLIIMSIKEPGVDGARVINGLERAGITTPIILLVPARELEKRREELAGLPNVLGCVAKPVDTRQLDKLMEFLRKPPTLKHEDKARLLKILNRIEDADGERI